MEVNSVVEIQHYDWQYMTDDIEYRTHHDWNRETTLTDEGRRRIIEEKIARYRSQSEHDYSLRKHYESLVESWANMPRQDLAG